MFNNLNDLSKLTQAYKGNTEGREVLTVSVDEIKANEQVRRKFENIDELSQSILVEGLQNPIIVSPKEDGKYVIQKGERRYRAILKAGLETIDIIVNNKELSDVDWIAGQVVENIQRENLTSLEVALALEKLLNLGLNQKAICERLGKSKSYVSQHVKLLELDSDIRTLADDGIIDDVETLNNLQTVKNLNQSEFEKLFDSAMSEDLSREDTRRAIRKLRASEDKPYVVDDTSAPFADNSYVETESYADESDDSYDDEVKEEKERTKDDFVRYDDSYNFVIINYISPEGEILKAKILTDKETAVGKVRIQLLGNYDNWRLNPFEVEINEIELVRIGKE